MELDFTTLLLAPLALQHFAQVLAIERCVQAQPWRESDFKSSLNSHHDAWVLATPQTELIGYFVQMPSVDVMELLLLAVKPAYQRQGIGTFLLKTAQQHAQTMHLAQMLLEVRASNLTAQLLYKKQGFSTIACRKKYYKTATGENEDALLLRCKLTP